jgi:hypothetical protein
MGKIEKVKLTKAQYRILNLMYSGWELGLNNDYQGKCWIQKGGLGRGGESEHNIYYGIIDKLEKLGFIERLDHSFSTTHCKITQKGIDYLK